MDHLVSGQSAAEQRSDHGGVRAARCSERARAEGQPLTLIMDQSKFSERHQVLMVALRHGRAWAPARGVAGDDSRERLGSDTQKALLIAKQRWIPAGTEVMLMGDRFLWHRRSDRLVSGPRLGVIACASKAIWRSSRATPGQPPKPVPAANASTSKMSNFTARRARTHIGIIHDPGHAEPWIVAMSDQPRYLSTLDYSRRWGIEPMFSDFQIPRVRRRGYPDLATPIASTAS